MGEPFGPPWAMLPLVLLGLVIVGPPAWIVHKIWAVWFPESDQRRLRDLVAARKLSPDMRAEMDALGEKERKVRIARNVVIGVWVVLLLGGVPPRGFIREMLFWWFNITYPYFW